MPILRVRLYGLLDCLPALMLPSCLSACLTVLQVSASLSPPLRLSPGVEYVVVVDGVGSYVKTHDMVAEGWCVPTNNQSIKSMSPTRRKDSEAAPTA